MSIAARCVALGFLILALALTPPVRAQENTPSDPAGGYRSCQTASEAEFRAAVEAITTTAIKDGLSNVDYRAAVADQWRRLDISRIIDEEVDKGVDAVRDENSWAALLKSLGSADKAQELTVAVAERVYRAPAMTAALDDLATAAGRDLASRIEIATSDAATPARACLEAFLGPRYGNTVAGIISRQAGEDFAIEAGTAAGNVTAGGLLRQSGEGLTGAAILVLRRQLANMAGRLGQRLVGSVLSRLVSVVAGGVGVVLIAKDVWDLRYGVLPIIATEMKSSASKAKVQEELATGMAQQINEHVADLGREAADRIVAIWRDYRTAHTRVLDLAERNSTFRAFLETVPASALPRTDEVTALILSAEGEAAVLARLANGTLDEAVKRLPEPAMDIARQTRNLETALAWNAVAGPHAAKVVEYEIFLRAAPDDFTAASLGRLMALDDPVAVRRLASLPRGARDALSNLDSPRLIATARTFSEKNLATLAATVGDLAPDPRARVLREIAKSPAALQVLTRPRVRAAIVSSADQTAALDAILRAPDARSPQAIMVDVQAVVDGRMSPEMLWHAHPSAVLAGIATLFALLLMLRRIFRRPRQGPPASNKSAT